MPKLKSTVAAIAAAALLGVASSMVASAQTPAPSATTSPVPTSSPTPAATRTPPSHTGPSESLAKPTNLRVSGGPTPQLTWDETEPVVQDFHLRISAAAGGAPLATFTVGANVRSFAIPPEFLPSCSHPGFVYGVEAFVTVGNSGFTEIPVVLAPESGCTDGSGPARLPGTGAGSPLRGNTPFIALCVALAAAGGAISVAGITARRRG